MISLFLKTDRVMSPIVLVRRGLGCGRGGWKVANDNKNNPSPCRSAVLNKSWILKKLPFPMPESMHNNFVIMLSNGQSDEPSEAWTQI